MNYWWVPVLTMASFLLLPDAAHALTITNDSGGLIGSYVQNFRALKQKGEQVIIDGPCESACTLVLGMIPRNKICATPRARFGFHSAWVPDRYGRAVPHRGGTNILMRTYPKNVRAAINRRGGLGQQVFTLSASEVGINPCR